MKRDDKVVELVLSLVTGPIGPVCAQHLQTAMDFRNPDRDLDDDLQNRLEAMARCEDCAIRLDLYRQVIRDVLRSSPKKGRDPAETARLNAKWVAEAIRKLELKN